MVVELICESLCEAYLGWNFIRSGRGKEISRVAEI